MVQPTFNHGVGTRFPIFFKKVLLKRARVHANPDGAIVVACSLDHFFHAVGITNVARVDPQTRRTSFGRLNPTFIMKVNVGHDWHRAFSNDFLQRL